MKPRISVAYHITTEKDGLQMLRMIWMDSNGLFPPEYSPKLTFEEELSLLYSNPEEINVFMSIIDHEEVKLLED